MSLLRIRLYPDPVLRVRCPEVTVFDESLNQLVEDMIDTMYAAPGVGLAAPQIGVEKRIAVVDESVGEEEDQLLILVNPVIEEATGKERDVEGCLSIPDFTEKVDRPTEIRVRAQDLSGETIEIEAVDFQARAICHEIDHLDGVLFVDRLRGLRKEKAKRHLKRLVAEAQVVA